MDTLDEALFDRVIEWAAAELGEARVRADRERFEQATGPMEEANADFETRMAHFFDGWLCGDGTADSPIGRFVAATQPEPSVRQQLASLERSHRTLFEFLGFSEGLGHVRDLLLHGRYRFAPAPRDRELRVGDRFDARLLVGTDRLWLSAGRVFHPREAYAAIDSLLEHPWARATSIETLLDSLLRMRSRFTRFESIRPEHVYSIDALKEPAFAAPWARAEKRAQRNSP